MLTAAQRRRFARHLLLAELGEQEQAKLCAAKLTLPAVAPRAADWAARYLERAGPAVSTEPNPKAEPGVRVALPSPEALDRLAGEPLLQEAAAALAGAYAAVEAIKSLTAVGTPGALSEDLVLNLEVRR